MGNPMNTFIIMEAAGCHDGDFNKAMRLVDLAREVAADACKFQWLSSPERLAERRHAPEYIEAYRALAFPQTWFDDLSVACSIAGLEFMCTVYLPEDIHVIAPYVSRFKIASFEATDTHFIALHAEFQKPILISTGMATAEEVDASAMAFWRVATGSGNRPAWAAPILLHCVSSYPCPIEQTNLAALSHGCLTGRTPHGFSDHTLHPWTGALAVAAGAQVIEFHARLDDTDPANADYAVARTPAQAAEYVRHVRLVEIMLGDGAKKAQECEAPMLRYRVRAL